MEKGENAGNQHFLLFPECLKVPKSGLLKHYEAMIWCNNQSIESADVAFVKEANVRNKYFEKKNIYDEQSQTNM